VSAKKIIGEIWESISHKFQRFNGSGLYYNYRLKSEMDKRAAYSTSRRNSIMKRWHNSDKLLIDKELDSIHTNNIRNTNVIRMEDENEDCICINSSCIEGVQGEKRKKSIKKTFIPPSFQEFSEYCKSRGFSQIADRAFNYYVEGGWKDKNGKQVNNWKQKLNGIWFRPENEDKKPETAPESSVYLKL
jgi:hypothetical protein